MASRKTSSSSPTLFPQPAGVQEASDTQGNGIIPAPVAAAFAVVEAVEQEPVVIEGGGNGLEPPPPPADTAAAIDPFAEIKKLRVRNKTLIEGDSDHGAVSMGPPPKDKFFLCPDDDDWYLHAMVWADPLDSRRIYYIAEPLWELSDLQGALRAVILVPWMLTNSMLGIWSISTKDFGGGDYRETSLDAVRKARRGWVRVQSDRKEKRWHNFEPHEALPDKTWPVDLTPEKFYRKAFGNRVVTSTDHPLVRRLRGLPEA
jgi:hypothetical protein